MKFSPTALLKLQRLARSAKKELGLVVKISTRQGIDELLKRAESESRSPVIFEAYDAFISILTEKDKEELASYNITLSPTTSVSIVEEEEESSEKKIPQSHRGRRYRGAAMAEEADYKQADIPEKKRKKGIYQGRMFYYDE